MHAWLKNPRLGHQQATVIASKLIRDGVLTRKEAIELVMKHYHNLDEKMVKDFCDFCSYSRTEFWKIIDKFYNPDLFEKDRVGQWILKNPIWNET